MTPRRNGAPVARRPGTTRQAAMVGGLLSRGHSAGSGEGASGFWLRQRLITTAITGLDDAEPSPPPIGPRGRCPAGRRSSPLRGRRRCCCRVCRLALAHGGVLIWRPAWRSSRSRSRPGPPPAQRRQSGWLGTRRVAPSPFVAAQRRRPPHRAPDFLTLEARLALKSPAPSGPPSHVQRNDVTSEVIAD